MNKNKQLILIITTAFNINLLFSAARSEAIAKELDEISNVQFESIKKLIEDGTNVNDPIDEHGNTFLIMAANDGTTDIVKLLIDAGADLDLKNKKGKNAIDCAQDIDVHDSVRLKKDKTEIAQLLQAEAAARAAKIKEREEGIKKIIHENTTLLPVISPIIIDYLVTYKDVFEAEKAAKEANESRIKAQQEIAKDKCIIS